jgi:glyoxylase-like metal-dependent hydrolase (beta-lactamase superfamily II)
MPQIIDLNFQNRAGVIATAVLPVDDGLALVDPGPSSCLTALEAGLAELGAQLSDVHLLLLTHIHLDHAGAAGTIVRRVPGCRVAVHERGAPHIVDPAKLLASASRLYGEQMDRLWGAVEPVPAEAIHIVRDGDSVAVEGPSLFVRETPGHAVHHVTYFDPAERVAYVGDTAGIRMSRGYLLAPTPPPDIDLEAWAVSLDRIQQLEADRLLVTHYGVVANVDEHLIRFRQVLKDAAKIVGDSLASPGDDLEKIRQFVDRLRADVRRSMSEAEAVATELSAPFEQLWLGLARYWRKRAASGSRVAVEPGRTRVP